MVEDWQAAQACVLCAQRRELRDQLVGGRIFGDTEIMARCDARSGVAMGAGSGFSMRVPDPRLLDPSVGERRLALDISIC